MWTATPRTHTYAIINAHSRRQIEFQQFPTTSAGISRALAWVGRRTDGDMACLWVVEGIGSYGARRARDIIAGVYRIRGWLRDPNNDNKAVLDLEELPPMHPLQRWIDRESPVQGKSRKRISYQYLTVRGAAFTPGQLITDGVYTDPVQDEVHFLSYL